MANQVRHDTSQPSGTGFAESPAGKLAVGAERQGWWRLKVAANGRVVIPAAARAAMRLDANGIITAVLDDGVLKLTSPAVAIAKLQQLVRERDTGKGSVIDELIAERRAEAERE